MCTLVTGTIALTTACMETTVVQQKTRGFQVIHGNRGVYHNDKQVFFKAIYTAMRDFKPGNNIKLLANHLTQNLQAVSDPYCGAND